MKRKRKYAGTFCQEIFKEQVAERLILFPGGCPGIRGGEEMERGQRKLFRKETGYIIRGLIWYFLVMILIAMGSTAVFLRGGMNRGEAEGAGYIIGVAAGVAVLFVRNILFGKKTDVFAETGKRMRFRTFAVFFSLILMIQLLFITGTWVIESVLNAAGLTMETAASHAAGEEHTGISMLLYSGIAGPVAEEIVHRGIVLKGLRKNGKAFALILSSLPSVLILCVADLLMGVGWIVTAIAPL